MDRRFNADRVNRTKAAVAGLFHVVCSIVRSCSLAMYLLKLVVEDKEGLSDWLYEI